MFLKLRYGGNEQSFTFLKFWFKNKIAFLFDHANFILQQIAQVPCEGF